MPTLDFSRKTYFNVFAILLISAIFVVYGIAGYVEIQENNVRDEVSIQERKTLLERTNRLQDELEEANKEREQIRKQLDRILKEIEQ